MCSLECPTVVAAISTHDHLPAEALQTLDQLNLLVRQHSGENLIIKEASRYQQLQ